MFIIILCLDILYIACNILYMHSFCPHPVCDPSYRKTINHQRTSWPSKCLCDITLCFCPNKPVNATLTSVAGVCIYLALAHSALTSFSLMSSQRLSCSICRSRSLMSPIVTHIGRAAHTLYGHRLLFSDTPCSQKLQTLSLAVFCSSPRAREQTVTTRSLSTEIHRSCSAAARQAVLKIFRIRICEGGKKKSLHPSLFFSWMLEHLCAE